MTDKKPKRKHLTIYTTPELHAKLKEHAKKENRSMGNMLAYAFETYLKYWVDGIVN